MTSRTTQEFRSRFSRLPQDIQRQARDAYKRFIENPSHPGLRFKLVHDIEPIYSVRISLHVRALGVRDADEIVWFWIGPHDEYERILSSL